MNLNTSHPSSLYSLCHRWQAASQRHNSPSRLVSGLAVLFSLIVWPAGSALADTAAPKGLKLIELYTSHGCSSCPAADQLLGELLAKDEDLLALEFHVDYWDNLVHGRDGNFVDPFSQVSHSMRQREYNAASLAGRPGVYTPQAVINGRFAAVGSNRRHITKALASPVEQAFKILISAGTSADTLSVEITGSDDKKAELAGTDISVAHYIDKATTRITGGENSNKTLTNHRIVTSLTPLGEVSVDGGMSFSVQKPHAGEGCVILVQEDARSPIYAAYGCP